MKPACLNVLMQIPLPINPTQKKKTKKQNKLECKTSNVPCH